MRKQPGAFMAILHPTQFVYDVRDEAEGGGLESKCQSLRVAINRAKDWETMLYQIRELLRLDKARRQLSIGVDLGTHIVYGESL